MNRHNISQQVIIYVDITWYHTYLGVVSQTTVVASRLTEVLNYPTIWVCMFQRVLDRFLGCGHVHRWICPPSERKSYILIGGPIGYKTNAEGNAMLPWEDWNSNTHRNVSGPLAMRTKVNKINSKLREKRRKHFLGRHRGKIGLINTQRNV